MEDVMLKRCSLKLFIILLFLSGNAYAQNWSSILDAKRASDWSTAGVEGGIPSATWTQCGTTKAAGTSAATINSAIQACPSNTYVQLGAGTFNLNTGLVLKSNVAIRGMGANQTFLVFSGVNGCNGLQGAVCMAGANEYYGSSEVQPGGSQSATWSGGYTQGTTQITLTNVGSNGITVGKYIYLDQNNDVATNSGFFVCEKTNALCSDEGGAGDPGRTVGGVARQQIQIVKVTGVNGSTYTISPGLRAPNWSSSYSPGAWWASSMITRSGVENLSMDISSTGSDTNTVVMMNANNVWVSGCRLVKNCTNCSRNQIWMWQVARASVLDNYFYGQTGQSVSYGVESYMASDCLIQNNIFQHTPAPMLLHSNQGSVYGYNFTTNNTYDDGNTPKYHWQIQSIIAHSAGVNHNLFEGNVVSGIGGDAIHGNPVMNTAFRNYLFGKDVNRIDNTNPVMFEAWARYWNVVGNVLGTPGYHNTYSGYSDTAIYLPGAGRGSISNDSVLTTTLMKWGNYDTVNAAVRWQTAEDGHTAATYPALSNASQTLPASFYLSAKPSWWPSGKAWPPIGPDVTGGSIANLGGHVHTIPAQDCYLNVMGGPADGTGGVLSFNASACYTATSVFPPSGLSVVPQ
jgi:hypothetical protein